VESLIGCDAPDERLVEIPALFDAGSSGDPSDPGIAVRRIGPYPDRTDRSRGDGRRVTDYFVQKGFTGPDLVAHPNGWVRRPSRYCCC
jgi:hypothetical protein